MIVRNKNMAVNQPEPASQTFCFRLTHTLLTDSSNERPGQRWPIAMDTHRKRRESLSLLAAAARALWPRAARRQQRCDGSRGARRCRSRAATPGRRRGRPRRHRTRAAAAARRQGAGPAAAAGAGRGGRGGAGGLDHGGRDLQHAHCVASDTGHLVQLHGRQGSDVRAWRAGANAAGSAPLSGDCRQRCP